jgi:NAD(P)-dependent dehydrogenase (short-subunit alcohol dehydrogenase family)
MQPVGPQARPLSEQQETVLVTGATGVLGSAIVHFLSDQQTEHGQVAKFRVVANYCRNAERAQQLHDQTGCETFRADISVEAEVEALFSHCGPLFAVVI